MFSKYTFLRKTKLDALPSLLISMMSTTTTSLGILELSTSSQREILQMYDQCMSHYMQHIKRCERFNNKRKLNSVLLDSKQKYCCCLSLKPQTQVLLFSSNICNRRRNAREKFYVCGSRTAKRRK